MDFPFSLIAGHVLCEMDGKRVLVDTGSLFSVGRERTMRFLGALTDLTAPGPMTTVESIASEIRALPGAPIDFDFDVLLGCDVLAGCAMEIDWDRSVLSVRPSAAGTLLPTPDEALLRLPRVWIEVNGHGFRAFADTGARVSYVLPEHVEGVAPAGTARDFLMGVGSFETRLASTKVKLCRREDDAAVGVAGREVEQLLRATKTDGIVGTDLMARCGKTKFLFGRPPDQDDDVAAPEHPHVLPLGLADGAIVVRGTGGPEMYVPRLGQEDRVSDTMLTLGVLGMVLGDRALFEQLLERFVNGGNA
jgi:hypothetical protein